MNVVNRYPVSQNWLTDPQAGSESWWQMVAQWGTPLVESVSTEQVKLTFLWRDPQGNAQQSALDRVYIDVNGVTDHHSFSPEYLKRLGDTDVWYWQTEVEADFRGSYSVIPVTAAQCLQLPEGTYEQRRMAQRNGWIALLELAECDPLNLTCPHYSHRGTALSAVHLSASLPQPAWQSVDAGNPQSLDLERLHKIDWGSKLLGNTRKVWLYTTGKTDHKQDRPLVILLDGQYWAQGQPVFGVLDQQTASGQLPPAVYVLIDVIDPQHRGEELPCNPTFWQAIQAELLPQVAMLEPFSELASRTVVAGQSYGGLAALYAGLHWPQRFGCVLSQSGSFWWPSVDDSMLMPDGRSDMAGWLTEQVKNGVGNDHQLTIFMEAGHREDVIYQVNQAMRQVLGQSSHRVEYRVYSGGHDAICWRGGLIDGLHYLLNPKTESDKYDQ
ncbi:enterochelin esterase [Yersinia ruckeri]|uniref:enterochelin esterase n=1 Tax=Yersinia ruckeri TaxID=29486 RepID=UPI002236FA67|nr:enterochelin esterase [Yersinia ruckeri]MCW6611504.1 enterochelin esterase [Yersinia ruckeri]MCW6618971.1 enterochelin esterase [Yersinia ruckeri]MCW6644686.1 enterochelin esterase [Yersinia ruckeri]